jgi:hypothetical protein
MASETVSLPGTIAYVTKPALREVTSMPRSLRLTLIAVLFSTIFANAACEDDPHDLDYLDAGDHGDHGDHDEDAG